MAAFFAIPIIEFKRDIPGNDKMGLGYVSEILCKLHPYLVSSKLVSYLTYLPTLPHRWGVVLLTASSSPCLGSYHRLLDLRGVQCGRHKRWLEMGGEVYPGSWILEEEEKCG